MVSVTIAAEQLELFMEHPYVVQGHEAKSNVHLTVLKDAGYATAMIGKRFIWKISALPKSG